MITLKDPQFNIKYNDCDTQASSIHLVISIEFESFRQLCARVREQHTLVTAILHKAVDKLYVSFIKHWWS